MLVFLAFLCYKNYESWFCFFPCCVLNLSISGWLSFCSGRGGDQAQIEGAESQAEPTIGALEMQSPEKRYVMVGSWVKLCL